MVEAIGYHPAMTVDRRLFVAGAAVLAAFGGGGADAATGGGMYGLIGRMTAKPGQRDALIAILVDGVAGMPGCLSYIVAKDIADADAIWITEVWTDAASHAASLTLPSVRGAIAAGRPLIAGMDTGTVTEPVGGHGLTPRPA